MSKKLNLNLDNVNLGEKDDDVETEGLDFLIIGQHIKKRECRVLRADYNVLDVKFLPIHLNEIIALANERNVEIKFYDADVFTNFSKMLSRNAVKNNVVLDKHELKILNNIMSDETYVDSREVYTNDDESQLKQLPNTKKNK